MRHLTVRTRNSKCYALRDIEVPKKTILRLGSVTPTAEITRRTDVIEINPAEACANRQISAPQEEFFWKPVYRSQTNA